MRSDLLICIWIALWKSTTKYKLRNFFKSFHFWRKISQADSDSCFTILEDEILPNHILMHRLTTRGCRVQMVAVSSWCKVKLSSICAASPSETVCNRILITCRPSKDAQSKLSIDSVNKNSAGCRWNIRPPWIPTKYLAIILSNFLQFIISVTVQSPENTRPGVIGENVRFKFME